MSNELAVKSERQVNPYRAVAEESAGTIRGDLVLFKKGVWTIGGNPIKGEKKFITNLDESVRGWVRWWDSRPAENLLFKIIEGPSVIPGRNSLGHLDENLWLEGPDGEKADPWRFTYYLAMRDAETGDDATFSTTSWGGRRAITNLYADFDKHRGEQKDCGMWPVVQLEQETRKHKQFGSVLEPRFPIVGWGMWGSPLLVEYDEPKLTAVNELNPPPLDDEIPF